MKILRYYVLSECVIPFFVALGVLTSVFILGNLIQLAHMVINKGVSLATVSKIFILYIPVLLGYTLPIACLVGIILAFSRLSADNEILALRACGIHLKTIIIPLILIGMILSLVAFILNDRIIPYAHHEQRKMIKTLGVTNPTALLEPGVFIKAFEKHNLFIHKIIDNMMYNIIIYLPQPQDKPTRTIIAKRGEFTGIPDKNQVILKLIDGTSDEPDPENPNTFYKLNFDVMFVTLNLADKDQKIDKKPKSMTLKELIIAKKQAENAFSGDPNQFETEFHRKISWSFSPLIFILLGFPIAAVTNKRGKSTNVVLAILVAAMYYLLTLGAEALSIENILPAWIAMWIPNLLVLSVAVGLNYRLCKA